MKTKYFSFDYNGGLVNWSFKRIDTSTWETSDKELSTLINCEHPAFIQSLHQGPTVLTTSLTYLVDMGSLANKSFFEKLLISYYEAPLG